LCRYLKWRQHEARIFNVGEQRRKLTSLPLASSKETEKHSADFFDPDNEEAGKLREKCALDTLNTLLDYLLDGNGSIGIFDATNSTVERRKLLISLVRKRSQSLRVLFVESSCGDKAVCTPFPKSHTELLLIDALAS
jgi:6-phosphofructo-2-kinase